MGEGRVTGDMAPHLQQGPCQGDAPRLHQGLAHRGAAAQLREEHRTVQSRDQRRVRLHKLRQDGDRLRVPQQGDQAGVAGYVANELGAGLGAAGALRTPNRCQASQPCLAVSLGARNGGGGLLHKLVARGLGQGVGGCMWDHTTTYVSRNRTKLRNRDVHATHTTLGDATHPKHNPPHTHLQQGGTGHGP
jgi:hypothetical protein